MSFWAGKRVLLTGHNGFKGHWLATWLQMLGASVDGLSLPERDVREFDGGTYDVVFHLAAQALVRRSFLEPEETWSVNVDGTRRLLERVEAGAVVVVTSDKCYAHADRPLVETDPLGGTVTRGVRDAVSPGTPRAEHDPPEPVVGNQLLADGEGGSLGKEVPATFPTRTVPASLVVGELHETVLVTLGTPRP